MFSYLPDAMRNEIGRHYKTFQSRKAVANFVDQQITGWTHTCPLRGEATPYQHNTPDRSLLTDPISEAHTAQYVRNAIALGELIGEGRSAAMLKSIITRCAEAKVTLVLFESPTSTLLDRHTPAGARARFRAIVGALAERHGITFLIEDDLHVRFAAGDWLEQSHLNVHGARRFTEALIDTTVLPATRAAYGVPADRNTVALHGR